LLDKILFSDIHEPKRMLISPFSPKNSEGYPGVFSTCECPGGDGEKEIACL
jgi:hypothetical protein